MTDLTREKIIAIVGPLEDDRIAAILATNANLAEVMEAFAWLSEDEYLGNALQRPMSGTVAEIYEILQADEPDIEEERGPGG